MLHPPVVLDSNEESEASDDADDFADATGILRGAEENASKDDDQLLLNRAPFVKASRHLMPGPS